jgi:hypothetical protein
MSGELFGGCLPAEGLAGAGVEFGGDRGDLLGAVDAQIGALRKILPQQPVGVLVARSLPRAGLLAEEHRHLERPGDLSVQRHFLALVPGQRAAHGGRQLREGLDEGVPDQVGGVPPVG